MTFPHRWDLHWVNPDPIIAAGIKTTRPSVVISPDAAKNLFLPRKSPYRLLIKYTTSYGSIFSGQFASIHNS